jgi:hypothetical protein
MAQIIIQDKRLRQYTQGNRFSFSELGWRLACGL